MKILYFTGHFIDDQAGFNVHAFNLCSAWKALGHDVRMVGPVRSGSPGSEAVFPEWVLPFSDYKSTLDLSVRYPKVIEKLVAHWKPDAAYVYPAIKDFLAQQWLTSHGISLFYEVNSIAPLMYLSQGQWLRAIATDIIERWELLRCAGIIGITDEIARSIASKARPGTPICVTGNGLDISSIPEPDFNPEARVGLQTPVDARVIVYVGNIVHYMGLDLLFPLLRNHPNWVLWIIGNGKEKQHLELLEKKLQVSSQVRWVDWVPSERLPVYLQAADAAIGPLALERKKLKEAQPLKVRTYLGAGLPVILGYRDPRIPNDAAWAKEVNAFDGEGLDRAIEELISLPTRDLAFRRRIQDFAIENLSWERIAQETIDFIERVNNGYQAPT